ncbi:uncharacterized protein [Macrobrachium rosenbergii]|uniref:uncharacterized protein n=1 Tax=Macrobrachium rosenbergii TaxID=79674 RepID=UPI0034D71698
MTTACETSTRWPCRYLPLALRKKAFNLTHGLSHPSGHAPHPKSQGIQTTWGANFTSSLWHSLVTSLGTKVNHTATYNPEANGMVEHLHLSLKAALTTKYQDERWRKELPWILLALRTFPHSAFNASPAEALYRQSLAIPADVLQDPTQPTTCSGVRRALEQIMPAKTTYESARKAYVLEELG